MKTLVVKGRDQGSTDVCEILSELNVECEESDLAHAVALARRRAHDAVIVDVDNEQTAKQFILEVRSDEWSEPLMVILPGEDTARDIALLEAGADECMSRPLVPAEVLARLRALVRRCEPGQGTAIGFEDLTLNLQTRGVMRQGQSISLTAREFAVLEYFVNNPRRIITRNELGENIWGNDFEGDSNVIDVFISRLRRKLDKPFDTPLLHTLIGSGYMLSSAPPHAN